MKWPFSARRARRLSRAGQHAKALAKCDTDPEVLSRAGMYLSLLGVACASPLYRMQALSQVGETEKAIALLPTAPFKPTGLIRSVAGRLSVEKPEKLLPVIRNIPQLRDIADYCDHVLNPSFDMSAPTLLGVRTAMARGDSGLAARRLDEYFYSFGLVPPEIEWRRPGIALESLARPAAGLPDIDGPKVSVVLTAFNEEQHISSALTSVLSQTWRNLEIIVVDDASTDRTADIVRKHQSMDSRIKLVVLPENVGLWRAKNRGFEYCTGDYITMHDADDWSHPSKIALQVAPLLKSDSLFFSSSYFFRVDEESGRPFTRNATTFLRWNPSSLLIRRDKLAEAGNFVTNLLGGDCEYVARLETLFGVDSHLRMKLPLSIGLQRRDSLSNRYRSTDYQQGLRTRLEHWEAWRFAHARLIKQGGALAQWDGVVPLPSRTA